MNKKVILSGYDVTQYILDISAIPMEKGMRGQFIVTDTIECTRR